LTRNFGLLFAAESVWLVGNSPNSPEFIFPNPIINAAMIADSSRARQSHLCVLRAESSHHSKKKKVFIFVHEFFMAQTQFIPQDDVN
jgi:hypothetical protein